MGDSRDRLRQDLLGSPAGDPPTAGELSRFVAGDLDDDASERVREYLTRDPELARTVLDLSELKRLEPPAGHPPMTEEQLGEAWHRFQQRVGEGTPESPRPRVEPASTGGYAWRKAAAVGAVMVGLLGALFGGWQLWRGERPSGGVELVELSPEKATTRGPGDGSEVVPVGYVHSGEREALLVLLMVRPPRYPQYVVEIVEVESGSRRARLSDVPLEANNTWTVRLPRGALEVGRYRVRVLGLESGEVPIEIATYRLDSVAP